MTTNEPTSMRLALALMFFLMPTISSANPVRTDYLTSELLASVTSVAPGSRFEVALKLKHDPHWHTYWLNPGDTGLPTKIKWTLPQGFSAGELEFPAPERIAVGELVNFGYEGEIVLLTTISAPQDLAVGQSIDLIANASWLICLEECIPGKAQLKLTLNAAAQAEASAAAPLIAIARSKLPTRETVAARFAALEGGGYTLELQGAIDAETQVFPLTTQLIHNAPPQSDPSASMHRFVFKQSDEFETLPASAEFLIVPPAARPYLVKVDTGAPPPPSTGAAPLKAPPLQQGQASLGLLTALALALLGGLILNLMPCVFPVLSLKALSFANLQGGERRAAVIDGLAYTAGVVLSFVALAGVLLALRAAGQAIGWGFQLQTPVINGALAYLFFAMGLSLVGAVSFGSSIMGVGQTLTEGHGARAAFFTGVLACVVASPCTAPFMGSALGYAVTQPAPLALLVFATLGFGLALPMLALSLLPRLSALLPRPGAWMVVFKQVLAFPLFLTAIWLIWVVGRQGSVDSMSWLLIGAVALAFALWLKDVSPSGGLLRVTRASAIATALLVAAACLWAVTGVIAPQAQAQTPGASEAYSAARLQTLRQEKTPVLINMTADWCLTCKVNERLALDSDRFRSVLAQNRVVYMKGDWTHYDAEITKFLARYGRNGVPLYVYFPANGEPQVLPQVLTPQLIADTLGAAP